MKLVIDRKLWLRSEGSLRSRMLREDGKMCCLGFHALACGFSKKEIFNRSAPVASDGRVFKAMLASNEEGHRDPAAFSEVVYRLMDINDNERLTAAEQESSIIEGFLELGVEVEFEG